MFVSLVVSDIDEVAIGIVRSYVLPNILKYIRFS